MRCVRRMPSSVKLKVAWLVAAFLVVWASAPAGFEGGPSEGVPASALAQSAGGVLREGPADVGTDLMVELTPGATVTARGLRLSVLEVEQEPFPVEGAQGGDRLVSVRVVLENLGAASITYTALDLGLEGADGSIHVRPGTRRGPGPMITYGVLEPGGSVVGWRVFVVSGSAEAVRLTGRLGPSG